MGHNKYTFELESPTDSIFLDAVNMNFMKVALNGKEITFSNSGERLVFKAPKELGKHQLVVEYATKPKQTVYFMGRRPSLGSEQVWTQGQGKYTSHWLPSIDDMNDKIEFDLTFLVEHEHEVIANGKLIEKIPRENRIAWKFDMTQPMSSYLAAFVIGKFDKKVLQSKSSIPIELYYEPKDSLRFEPTYRYTKEIFDFFEEEIGVDYPWQNYKQVPVRDFLYAGMENTTCTIFSNQYVIDSTAFVDKNYVNVNAHEMAHQWFGNLVTEESGEHHWLHEGFATYYAYLAEKHLFGEDHFYWKLYQTAKTLHNLSEDEGGEALTDPNANSLTFYEKGAWALVMLRERVGDKVFRNGIENYLNTYAFKNVTISNFLSEMEKASEQDLEPFREKWLESEEFHWEEVKSFLSTKNTSLKLFFELKNEITGSTVIGEGKLKRFWEDDTPIPFKRQFIFDYGTQIPDSTLVKLLEKESLEVRQSVALTLPEISNELQYAFESLLDDNSYVTKENVLFKLWQAFPEKQGEYLDKLSGVVGLPNKNVRLLWLTLALITEEYQSENKRAFYNELNAYTNSDFNFEVRQLAFQYLFQIRGLDDKSLENLLQASQHHVWQFKKSSRNLFRELNLTEEGKIRLIEWRTTLSKKQNELLDTILNP